MVVAAPETPISELSFYSARPTILVDGQSYPLVSELLQSMSMTEYEGGLSALELRFINVASDTQGEADFAFEDDAILKFGAAILVYSGDESAPQEIFRGKITGLEAEFQTETGVPELVVLAEDAFQQGRMERRTQIYNNISIAQLGQTLASRLGLEPRITGFTEDIGTQVQLNESDLAFLRRLLAQYDGDIQVVGQELHLSPRADVKRGEVVLELHSQLRNVHILADLAHQVTEITVSGWNPNSGQRTQGRSVGAGLGSGSGQTGAQILPKILQQRSHHIGHLAVSTDTEAQALADAAFDERARRFLCLEGTAEGNPALRVGTWVQIQGMGERFDNTYYVVQACHRFDLTQGQGYETDFLAECTYWRGRA